jgi:hypothetical protein
MIEYSIEKTNMKRILFFTIIIMVLGLGFCFSSTASASLSDSEAENKALQYVSVLCKKSNINNVLDKRINKERFVHTKKQNTHYIAAEVVVSVTDTDAKLNVMVYLEIEDGIFTKTVNSNHYAFVEGSKSKEKYNNYRNFTVNTLTKAHNFGRMNGPTQIIRGDTDY